VAVRIGFDDDRSLGEMETGGRTALPIFREVMLQVYGRQLVGPVPQFPSEIEERIDEYLARQVAPKITPLEDNALQAGIRNPQGRSHP
jgi:membrane carboxypeptidase/penicillin-binding protein